MAAATERIPVLVTKSDKARFEKKARSCGFDSISAFARQAMDTFTPTTAQSEQTFAVLLKEVKEGTKCAEARLDRTIAVCNASNQRMADVEIWMKQKGYA
jgi:hypothetical protein